MKPAIGVYHLTVLLAAFSTPLALHADVVVIVNRTTKSVEFVATTSIAPPQEITLAAGDLVPIPVRAGMQISCSAARPTEYSLSANSAYFFQRTPDETLTFSEIDLQSDASTRSGRDLGNGATWDVNAVIPVKLLVDDEEPAARKKWEARLRGRLEAAAEIFLERFRVRFEVVAVETWDSDSSITDFEESLSEFAREVDPRPARLAIGFTSQYQLSSSTRHLGGLRGPLKPHILIREWPPHVMEWDRREVLVHELGHFLGATHSPEATSVMRPQLGDSRSRQWGFRIDFDPLNTLAVYLLAEELRFRKLATLSQLSPGTAIRLRQLYRVAAESMPEDPGAKGLLRMMEAVVAVRSSPLGTAPFAPGPSVDDELRAAARRIVQQLVIAARANAKLPLAAGAGNDPLARRTGDELTAHYVRQASQAALAEEPELAPRAMLLALGIGLDDSRLLVNNPLLEQSCRGIETATERADRIRVLGQPTVHGRRDLAQHFFVSGLFAAVWGTAAAEAAGVAKEILDAHGASGFSFADLAADQAGITFGNHVLARKLSLRDLAGRFTVADFAPSISGLPENLRWEAFVEQFGSVADERCQRLRRQIQNRIDQLPGYRAAKTGRVDSDPHD
jgi:hypothetical protein